MKKLFQPSKKLFGFIIFIFAFVVLLIGSTYAYQQLGATSNTAQGQGGCFQVNYSGQNLDAGSIVSTDNYLNGAHTTVTLSKDSTCKIYTEANIYIHTNNETTAPIDTTEAMRYKLVTNDGYERNGFITVKGDTLLGSVALTDTSTTYTIYVWVDSDLSEGAYHNTSYSGYIYAESAQTSTVQTDTNMPTLFLKKESYIDIPFDNSWTLTNSTISNGILTLGANGNTASALSNFIRVNGDFWYMTFDGYVTTVSSRYSPKGGIFWSTRYYDNNKNSSKSLDNYAGNGSAVDLTLNSWHNNIYWKTPLSAWRDAKRYGPNVQYLIIDFSTDGSNDSYDPPPIMIRNVKVYGQVDSSFYDIYVNSSDNIGITTIKYAKGSQPTSYFTNNGTNVTNNKVTVTENGTYTFYVSDVAGNSSITTIDITNIV